MNMEGILRDIACGILVLLALLAFAFIVYQGGAAAQEGDASAEAALTGPEIAVIGSLSNLYEPVTFSHRYHTTMAGECAGCHHHSDPGVYMKCGDCHGAPFDPQNMNMPGLKGAYHLQCMNCHKEMAAGPVGCTECHAKKPGKE